MMAPIAQLRRFYIAGNISSVIALRMIMMSLVTGVRSLPGRIVSIWVPYF